MKATLNDATAAEYELLYKGGDTITIVGFGQVNFSKLSLTGAARVAEIKDANGNSIYLKKKEPKTAPKSTQPDKS